MKTTLRIIVLFFYSSVQAQIDSMQMAQVAAVELSKITTVVEGEILKVEYYAGDENGIKMPESSLVWDSQGYGYYTLPNGQRASGYTLATLKVCQVYKGNTTLDTLKILSKPIGFVVYKMPYLDRDTTWYDFRVLTFDQWPKENYISPRQVGNKYIYFCYPWDSISLNDVYKLSIIGNISFRSDWRPNSHIVDKHTFVLPSGPLAYFTSNSIVNRQQMNAFLVSIPLLSLDVASEYKCAN